MTGWLWPTLIGMTKQTVLPGGGESYLHRQVAGKDTPSSSSQFQLLTMFC